MPEASSRHQNRGARTKTAQKPFRRRCPRNAPCGRLSSVSQRARFLVAILLIGPGLLVAGALLGRWIAPAPAPVWSEGPAQSPLDTATRVVGMPSLAPIVRRVGSGVVGVRTVRRLTDPPEDAESALDVVNGTGFIINASGLAVTNQHLVAGHKRIMVEVSGYQPVRAELVGADPITDIAVLRFRPPTDDLTVLELGDSTRIEQGDWVLAIGNPYLYRQTVTVGTVSYVGRHIPEEGLLVSNEYLQFSASVNPGSSGGPVLDMAGNVVGVTTHTHSAGSDISFAVPSKVLKWVLQEMDRADGRVRRGFLGVRLAPLDPVTAASLGIAGGALIRHVADGLPADRAGLRAQDVVVSYNGRAVPDAYALFDWITYSRPGGEVSMDVMRNGERISALVAKLGEVEYPEVHDAASETLRPTSSN